jgi:transcriptional regulator GlxA family with amidase domain
MFQVTILALEGINIGSIENPRRAFLSVNESLKVQQKPPLFKVQLAGFKTSVFIDNGLYTIHPDVLIKNVKKAGLIIIPALSNDISKSIKDNQEVLPWLVNKYKTGSEIASLCVGAFLLAATGLLDGRECSTHWRAENDFRRLFPKVNLVTHKIMTDEKGLYTSGGAFSSANLILYLIEKYAGREMAVYCAKVFQVDMSRNTQSQFIIFQGQKSHEDECVKKAQLFIEKNYGEKISVNQLASMAPLGRRSFERRFKKATDNSAVEYMQRVKIEVAKKSLETSLVNVNQVMYEVGYSDPKSFRDTFRKITGLSPLQYRNKYYRDAQI